MNSFTTSINQESLRKMGSGIFLSPKTSTVVSWVMIVLIIYLTSMFAWSVWGSFQPRQKISVENVSSSHKTTIASVNIHQLTQYNLFGDTESKVEIIENSDIDAPVTRLKLKLRGVYAASEKYLAGAMIEANNKQEVYRIGSKLPGATGLKLHKIFSDRVIMSRGEKFETLLIEDFAGESSILNRSDKNNSTRNPAISNVLPIHNNRNIIDRRSDKNLSNEMYKLRSKLTDPKSLNELVSISAAMNGEEFEGFRLAPGKNRALFGRLGLRRNDILTEVNGISLNDPASSFSLMEQISSADEINMTIRRGERDMNVLFKAEPQ